MGYGDAAWQRSNYATEDLLGHDRLARSFLRVLNRMARGSLIAVHGAPGSGKTEFLQRMAYLASESSRTEVGAQFAPNVVWYDPWAFAKEGHILAGLLAHIAASAPRPTAHTLEKARDVSSYLAKMHFGTTMAPGFGSLLAEGNLAPIDRVQAGFQALVEGVKSGYPGRLLVLVTGLDDVAPALRFLFIDGMRLLLQSGADITVVLSIGREAALAAIRHREGDVPEASASRHLDELVDLTLTVPNLDARRISALMRRYLGDGENVLSRSFGPNALAGLSSAVSYKPLGSPRFLQRLAARVVLLSEYLVEARATRELTDGQWAWAVLSERWPEFRRFLIRGGRERWMDLRQAMAQLHSPTLERPTGGAAAVHDWLRQDPILADYLRGFTDAFERDLEGIFWMENLLLSAGL